MLVAIHGNDLGKFQIIVCLSSFLLLTNCTDKTLEENGIEDEEQEFEEMGINEEYYIPALHLYFNDDLTED